MSTIPVIVPNLDIINKENSHLSEAVKKLQDNANLSVTDHRIQPPSGSPFDPSRGHG